MHRKNIRILLIIIGIGLAGFASIGLISIEKRKTADNISGDCSTKQIIWGNGQYDIVDLPQENKIVMKVAVRNKKSWHIGLQPIQKPKTEFDTCEAAIYKASPD
nr:hypothetical protein [Candidatus Woesebacteria bacterium]